jgi:hypothetical protein
LGTPEIKDAARRSFLLKPSQHFQGGWQRIVTGVSHEEDRFPIRDLASLFPEIQNLPLSPARDYENEKRGAAACLFGTPSLAANLCEGRGVIGDGTVHFILVAQHGAHRYEAKARVRVPWPIRCHPLSPR